MGAGSDRTSEFRLLTATNEPLGLAVATGRFRTDLWYRLNVAALRVPALRERMHDIPDLVQHFLAGLNGHGAPVAPCALEALTHHGWPGNVRELRSLVSRLAGEAEGGAILAPAVSDALGDSRRSGEQHPGRERLLQLLTDAGGNVRLAARAAGVHVATMYRRLARAGLRPVSKRDQRHGAPEWHPRPSA